MSVRGKSWFWQMVRAEIDDPERRERDQFGGIGGHRRERLAGGDQMQFHHGRPAASAMLPR